MITRHRTFSLFLAAAAFLVCSPGARAYDPVEGLDAFDHAWDIVQRTYFDSTFAGLDWRAVKADYRPRAATAESYAELRGIIQAMLDELGTSHFFLYSASAAAALEGEYSGGGTADFEIRVSADSVLVFRMRPGSPGAQVRPGWRLDSVNGIKVSTLLESLPNDLPPFKRSLAEWGAVLRNMYGPVGSVAELEFVDSRGSRHRVEHVLTSPPQGSSVKFGHFPRMNVLFDSERRITPGGAEVGILRFNLWMLPSSRAFDAAMDTLRDCDGMVIDLRGNVGGAVQMILGVAGHFFESPTYLGSMISRRNNLEMKSNPRVVNTAGEVVEVYQGPLAILVDGLSYSASELFAACMQSLGRARVFGRPTPGGAVPATFDQLASGRLVLEHPVADFVVQDGTRVEGVGVTPDVLIPWDSVRMESGIDIDLEAALSWIDQETKP